MAKHKWGDLPEDVERELIPEDKVIPDQDPQDPTELRDYLAQVADEQGLNLSADDEANATEGGGD